MTRRRWSRRSLSSPAPAAVPTWTGRVPTLRSHVIAPPRISPGLEMGEDPVPDASRLDLQARGHWFEPSTAHLENGARVISVPLAGADDLAWTPLALGATTL
ncbi:hypothetical protein Pmi06nite_10170 [Planotetraspora mira]|uniref:Uncharacterized protein n=1 Tax=Planotetraspora mira TaxID=58121 RepID=A0A8J3X4J2_9ACTN|nr:hypothetical protein Pmi06nite_10170 [Planotetraspora mira]